MHKNRMVQIKFNQLFLKVFLVLDGTMLPEMEKKMLTVTNKKQLMLQIVYKQPVQFVLTVSIPYPK